MKLAYTLLFVLNFLGASLASDKHLQDEYARQLGVRADDIEADSEEEVEEVRHLRKRQKQKTKSRTAAEISALTESVKTVFSLEDINRNLPHRYSFLLVDKVVEYEQGKRAVGIKSVTFNEPQSTGQFPDSKIMPGVLQVEALAQLAAIVLLKEGAEPGAVFFFAGVDGVKWKRPVVPGDTLVMEVEIKKSNNRNGIATATGRAYVDGEMAVELDEMKFELAE